MVTVARQNQWTPLTFPHAEICRIYKEVTAEEPDDGIPAEFPLSEEAFRAALDPREIVRNRRTAGGPQPGELERQLDAATQQLHQDEAWLERKFEQLAESEARTDAEFEAFAAQP